MGAWDMKNRFGLRVHSVPGWGILSYNTASGTQVFGPIGGQCLQVLRNERVQRAEDRHEFLIMATGLRGRQRPASHGWNSSPLGLEIPAVLPHPVDVVSGLRSIDCGQESPRNSVLSLHREGSSGIRIARRSGVVLELAVAIAIAAVSSGVAGAADDELPVRLAHDKDLSIEVCHNDVTVNGMEVPVPDVSVGLRRGGGDGSPIRGPDGCD